MKIMQETTEWATPTPNHVYVMNDSMTQIIAYVPAGSTKLFKFKAPINFDRRGRNFVDLPGASAKPRGESVVGSRGETYMVDRKNGTCTCKGFLYRGQCRHLQGQ